MSGEKDEFVRDIEIPTDANFHDLHLAIQLACEYDNSLMTSFYISDNDWDKGQELVIQKMDEESQQDVMLMEEVLLSKFINKIGNRLIYIFDFFSVRFFFIEVVNIRNKTDKDNTLEFPISTLSNGEAPAQILVDELDDLSFDDDVNDEFNDYEDMGLENIDDYDL